MKNAESQNSLVASILAFVIVLVCVGAAFFCFDNGDTGFGVVFSILGLSSGYLAAVHSSRKAGGLPKGHDARVIARGRALKAQQGERKPRP